MRPHLQNPTSTHQSTHNSINQIDQESRIDLGEKADGAEEGGPDMGGASKGAARADGSVVLDDPEGEVDGDALLTEEVRAFSAGVGLEEVPESATDAHGREEEGKNEGEEKECGKRARGRVLSGSRKC